MTATPMSTMQKHFKTSGYFALDVTTVLDYLSRQPRLSEILGQGPKDWSVQEIGDGNLNLVFLIKGHKSGLIIKQALPYVRMVGDSWPLPLYRSHYEHMALVEQARHVPQFVPRIYHHDEEMALSAMEYLSPHKILRGELILGRQFPQMAQHMGTFLASSLFQTSDLHLSAGSKREIMSGYLGNIAMCKITEDLIFDEPYFAAPLNRHTAPGLDQIALAFQQDKTLKLAAQEMKWRFLNTPEALCHGDLHTGSIMATETDTRVIDPEFAFYGPIGFDVGMLLANYLMAYYAREGHEENLDSCRKSQHWLLDLVIETYEHFIKQFAQLWRSRTGEAYQSRVVGNADSDAMLQSRLDQIWQDVLGFCGVEIIRRILGLAHVADFETIKDPEVRAGCELKALELGCALLVNRAQFRHYSDLRGLITA